MPGMRGGEALVKLKDDLATAHIPVVIVTSRVLSVAERAELLERAFEVVSKEGIEKADIAGLLGRAVPDRDLLRLN